MVSESGFAGTRSFSLLHPRAPWRKPRGPGLALVSAVSPLLLPPTASPSLPVVPGPQESAKGPTAGRAQNSCPTCSLASTPVPTAPRSPEAGAGQQPILHQKFPVSPKGKAIPERSPERSPQPFQGAHQAPVLVQLAAGIQGVPEWSRGSSQATRSARVQAALSSGSQEAAEVAPLGGGRGHKGVPPDRNSLDLDLGWCLLPSLAPSTQQPAIRSMLGSPRGPAPCGRCSGPAWDCWVSW